MGDILGKLLSSNSGISSTRFIYVAVNVLAFIIILICGGVMIIEVLKPSHMVTDIFSGIAQVIGAISMLILFAGATKAASDKFSQKKTDYKHKNKEV